MPSCLLSFFFHDAQKHCTYIRKKKNCFQNEANTFLNVLLKNGFCLFYKFLWIWVNIFMKTSHRWLWRITTIPNRDLSIEELIFLRVSHKRKKKSCLKPMVIWTKLYSGAKLTEILKKNFFPNIFNKSHVVCFRVGRYRLKTPLVS